MATKAESIPWIVWLILLLIVLIGAGVFVRQLQSDGSEEESNFPSPTSNNLSPADPDVDFSDGDNSGIDNSLLPRRLLDSSEYSSDFARSVALDDFLAPLNTSQLIELVEHTQQHETDFQLRDTQVQIIRRLAVEDPIKALDCVRAFPIERRTILSKWILREWTLSDLNSAVEYAQELGETERKLAFSTILDANYHLSEDDLRKIGVKLNIESFANRIIDIAAKRVLLEDPMNAWNATLHDDVADANQEDILAAIAKEWTVREGFDAVKKILESAPDWYTKFTVLREVLEDLVIHDPQTAFEWSSLLPDDVRRGTVSQVVLLWSGRDPKAAWQAVSRLPNDDFRDKLHEKVAKAWGRTSPISLLEQIELLPSNLQTVARNYAIRSIASENPRQAAGLIHGVPNGPKIVKEIVRAWTYDDMHEALEWVLGNEVANKYLHDLFPIVIEKLDLESAEFAFKTALAQTTDEFDRGLELHVIRRVADLDISKSKSLLRRVRDGATKLEAYNWVGDALVRSSEFDEALRLGNQLSGSVRIDYYNWIARTWVIYHPEEAYDSIDSLSTESAKSTIALELLSHSRVNEILTEQQVDDLSRYLPEDDTDSL